MKMHATGVLNAEQSRNNSLARTRRLPYSHASKSVSDIPADAASRAGVRRERQRKVRNRRPIRVLISETSDFWSTAVHRGNLT